MSTESREPDDQSPERGDQSRERGPDTEHDAQGRPLREGAIGAPPVSETEESPGESEPAASGTPPTPRRPQGGL